MLWIFGNYRQDDWCEWLPIVQYAIYARCSESTKQVLFKTWMGCVPRAHQPDRPSCMPKLQQRKEILIEVRRQAAEAMKHAMELQTKLTMFKAFVPGDKVWLEGTNLQTMHPTAKLQPKQFGLFKVIEAVSPTTYSRSKNCPNVLLFWND